jgi:carboxylesterase type B
MFSRKIRKELDGDEQTLRAFAFSPNISWGRAQEQNGYPPIYTYFFERTRPGDEVPAPHSAEIAYVFGNLSADSDRAWEDTDYKLSAAMTKYWVSFAKTGDPNGGGLTKWASYTSDSPLTMSFRDDGFDMRELTDNKQAERVIAFTVENPGMLEAVSGFFG